MKFEILPGRGVGPILLGSSRREVEQVLGTPNRVETDEGPEDAEEPVRSESWHYERAGISLYFDEDAEFRLGLIDLDVLEASIRGVRPVGLEIDEAQKLFQDNPGFELEEEFSGTGRAVYELPGTSVSLWFQDGVCDSVQVAVPIAEDGEYLWPNP